MSPLLRYAPDRNSKGDALPALSMVTWKNIISFRSKIGMGLSFPATNYIHLEIVAISSQLRPGGGVALLRRRSKQRALGVSIASFEPIQNGVSDFTRLRSRS